MNRKRTDENNIYLPKAGNPTNEAICCKTGRTLYEAETTCGAAKPLYNKLVQLHGLDCKFQRQIP